MRPILSTARALDCGHVHPVHLPQGDGTESRRANFHHVRFGQFCTGDAGASSVYFATFRYHVIMVFAVRAEPEMSWVAARGVIAGMTDDCSRQLAVSLR